MANPTIPELEIKHENDKWIIDYQPVDEAGQPIGKPTHIEADTQQELIQKQYTANVMAVRALYKAKPDPTKVTLRKAPVVVAKPTIDEDNVRQVQFQDPGQRRNVIQADIEAAAGVPLSEIASAAGRLEEVNARLIANDWKAQHINDYYNCGANNSIIGQYLDKNNMATTYENIDIAFDAVQEKLIPFPEVAPDKTNTQTRQRQVPTGLIPGETSYHPPSITPGLSWADVDSLNYDELRTKRNDPKWENSYLKLMKEHPRGKRRN